jgi:hypothetical protein
MATLASSNVKPAPPESSGDETIARSSQLKTANHCDCTLYYQARSDKPFAALTVTTNRCSEVLARLKGHREIFGVQVAPDRFGVFGSLRRCDGVRRTECGCRSGLA